MTSLTPNSIAGLNYYPAKRLAGLTSKFQLVGETLIMPHGGAITPGQQMTVAAPTFGDYARTRTISIRRITPAKVFYLCNGKPCAGASHLDFYLAYGSMFNK